MGVHETAVQTHFKMQMRAGDVTGGAGSAQRSTLQDTLSAGDVNLR